MISRNRKMNKSGSRGSVLIISILLLFIMLTLALAVVSQESMARKLFIKTRVSYLDSQTRTTAFNRLEGTFQGKTGELDQVSLPGEFSFPAYNNSDFVMSGSVASGKSVQNKPPTEAGRDYLKVPDVGFTGSTSTTKTGYNGIKVPPWMNLMVVDSPSGNKSVGMFSSAFPYGAYAPKGTIELAKVVGGANPTMEDYDSEKDAANKAGVDFDEVRSGIPVRLYAKGKISVGDFVQGKALSVNGPIEIAGGGIGFSGIKEQPNFAKTIKSQADAAYTELKKDTLDKSYFVMGAPLSISNMFYMLFNPDEFGSFDFKEIFSMEQALRFPFLTIPTFSSYGVMHVLMLHVPYPPDNALLGLNDFMADVLGGTDINTLMPQIELIMGLLNVSKSGKEGDERYYKTSDILKAFAKLEAARVSYNSGMDFAGYKDHDRSNIPAALNKLHDLSLNTKLPPEERQKAANAYDSVDLWKKLPTNSEALLIQYYEYRKRVDKYMKDAKNADAGGVSQAPETREQEKEYEKNKTYVGYPFAQVLIKLGTVVADTIKLVIKGKFSSIPAKIAEIFVSEIRVVHFEDKGPYIISYERKDSTLGAPAVGFKMGSSTWTVPRGRTLRMDMKKYADGSWGTMHVNKLWIQDGATLYVNGNLKVDDLTYMGSGSTIIVSGNAQFDGGGSVTGPLKGSIWLTSPVGKVKGITSGIIVKGTLKITNGVIPGVTPGAIATKILKDDTVEKVLMYIFDFAPVIAKVFGPFHSRFAYFAAYPATIRIIQVLFVPVPFPSPTATKNINRTIFKIVTQTYKIELNAMLGEYLFTHSDWWVTLFREGGRVPILPKLDVKSTFEEAVDTIKSISLSDLPDPADIASYAGNIMKNMGQSLIEDLAAGLVVDLGIAIGSFIAASVAGEIGSFLVDTILGPIVNKITDALGLTSSDESSNPLGAAASALIAPIYDLYVKAQVKMISFIQSHMVFNEVPGLFAYSETELQMGGATASGMFVSKGNLTLTTGRVVGSLMSIDGSIDAPDVTLSYYPYFTRASLTVPDKKSIWENLILVTANQLKGDNPPENIGVDYYHVQTEGWTK